MGVFDMFMEKPAEVQTHSPLRLTSAGFFMTISNTPIASTDFSKFFHDYVKHTHGFLTKNLLNSVEELCE
jgi:hypothetical protein